MRRLLDPLVLSLTAFGLQIVLWWIFMPAQPTLQGGAGRYESLTSVLRYAVFLAIWIEAILVGKALVGLASRRGPQSQALRPLDLSYLITVAKIAGVLAIFGELVYIRDVLQNPHVLIDSFREGAFMDIGAETRNERVVGISSLNNLFVIPAAVYALMAFNLNATKGEKTHARRSLTVIGVLVFIHALLFVGRQLFVIFMLITLGAYLLNENPIRKVLLVFMPVAVLLIGVAIWAGETARSGTFYAENHHVPLFSLQTQNYVSTRLIEGYFASDLNNAFRLLSCESSMDFIGITLWKTPAQRLGFTATPLTECPRWKSITYNTANIFGWWWWDSGWFGLLSAFVVGTWLGATYKFATEKNQRSGFTCAIYLLAFPGIISLTRINFFAATVFVVPTLFLIAARFLQPDPIYIHPKARARYAQVPRTVRPTVTMIRHRARARSQGRLGP